MPGSDVVGFHPVEVVVSAADGANPFLAFVSGVCHRRGKCADGEGGDVLKALSLKEVEGEPGHFTGIAEDGADISAGGKVS